MKWINWNSAWYWRTEDLLKYDIVPSPMLFDDYQFMTNKGNKGSE